MSLHEPDRNRHSLEDEHDTSNGEVQAAPHDMSRQQRTARGVRGRGGGPLLVGRGDARSFSGMMPLPDNERPVSMDLVRKLSEGAANRGLGNPSSYASSMPGSRSGSGRRGLGPTIGRGGHDIAIGSTAFRTGTPPGKQQGPHETTFDALALYNATQDGNKAYTSRSRPVAIEPQATHDVLARQKARLRKVLDSGYDMWTEKEKYKSLYLQQQIELHAREARDEEARRVIVALEGEKTVLRKTA